MTNEIPTLRDPQDRRLPRISPPCGLVIFGITGDLARKKLLPAIYDLANRGLLSLINGDLSAAEADIAKATTFGDVKYAQGVLNIAKGNYSAAESDFKGLNTNSTALAQILNKNYATAVGTLDDATFKGAMNTYLHAIAAARRDNKYAANSYLKEALEQDPSLAPYAEKDLELAITRK